MNKSIKVSENVYHHLQDLQRPRETFSDIVSRLLYVYALLEKAQPAFGQLKQDIEARVK